MKLVRLGSFDQNLGIAAWETLGLLWVMGSFEVPVFLEPQGGGV